MFRLLLLIASAVTLSAAPGSPVLTVGILSDSNTSNSIRQEKDDTAATASVSLSSLRVINRNWQGNLRFNASTSRWKKFDGLDLSPVSVQGGLRRKFGFGPYAPTVDLTVEWGRRFASTSERTSNFGVGKLAYSQRINPSLKWRASAEIERYSARRQVFSTTRHAFRVGADYELNDKWSTSVSLAHGKGDLVSWCRISFPEFAGTTQWLDGIFGGDWFPYQTVSKTTALHFSLSRALSNHSAVAISADLSKSAGTVKRHIYYNDIFSLQFIHAF
ncbi:MAG: hypothetical protein HOH58_10960 [Opitutaceae bacterium]|jgi:hypothetical protein|nr:hypothetical protein [Opitutaceae bacterium]